MNTEEYEKMFRMEEYSWWFRGRQAIVEKLLERHTSFASGGLRILDVGCGTGKILRDFTERGHRVVGLDFSDLALEFTSGRGAEELIRGDATCLPIADDTFDLIVALDIMEHVPDDAAMAAELMRVLRPGGSAVLTVPAIPALWSEHDEALHHFRRYTRRSFRTVLQGAGFEFVRFTNAISSLLPAALTYRVASKLLRTNNGENSEPKSHMFRLPRPINSLLTAILYAEAAVLGRVNLPAGLSLLAIVSKRSEAC